MAKGGKKGLYGGKIQVIGMGRSCPEQKNVPWKSQKNKEKGKNKDCGSKTARARQNATTRPQITAITRQGEEAGEQKEEMRDLGMGCHSESQANTKPNDSKGKFYRGRREPGRRNRRKGGDGENGVTLSSRMHSKS